MKSLRIEGAIGDFGNTAEEFQARLDELQLSTDEELQIIINSPGGSVFEGFAIYNKLKTLPNEITVKVEGLAASIATLIALAGNKVEMSQVGLWMVHRASTMVAGNKEELEKQIQVLETIDNTLITVYAEKTGMSRDVIEELLSKETFYDAEQALEKGWIDEIVDKVDAKMAADFEHLKPKYMSKLSEMFAAFKAEIAGDSTEPSVPVVDKPAGDDPNASTDEPDGDDGTTLTLEDRVSNLDTKFDALSTLVKEFIGAAAEDSETAEANLKEQVKAKFEAMIITLPKSNGKTPNAADNGLNNGIPTYEPKFGVFKAKMAEIDKLTRKI